LSVSAFLRGVFRPKVKLRMDTWERFHNLHELDISGD
jgi:hypothetical protein